MREIYITIIILIAIITNVIIFYRNKSSFSYYDDILEHEKSAMLNNAKYIKDDVIDSYRVLKALNKSRQEYLSKSIIGYIYYKIIRREK